MSRRFATCSQPRISSASLIRYDRAIASRILHAAQAALANFQAIKAELERRRLQSIDAVNRRHGDGQRTPAAVSLAGDDMASHVVPVLVPGGLQACSSVFAQWLLPRWCCAITQHCISRRPTAPFKAYQAAHTQYFCDRR